MRQCKNKKSNIKGTKYCLAGRRNTEKLSHRWKPQPVHHPPLSFFCFRTCFGTAFMDHRIKLPDQILCFPLISHFSYVILFSIHILKGKTMDKKPNIVIIMADQLRYDMINKQYTPNISALADNSVVFQRAYCASPLCVPARGSFFTGNYPNVSGSIINPWDDRDKAFGYVKAGTPNLFSLLENTYDSWHVGKQHFLTQEYKNNGPSPNTHLISIRCFAPSFNVFSGRLYSH